MEALGCDAVFQSECETIDCMLRGQDLRAKTSGMRCCRTRVKALGKSYRVSSCGTISRGERMKLRGSETDAVVEMLQKAPLWSGLTERELKVVARSFRELKYKTGDVIVRKGEAGVGFYLIADGTVEVRSDGRVLSKLGPGQYFGEMSLLDGQPRSADVVALEPLRCLALTSWSFKSMVSEHPNMALKLLQESVRRLRVNT
jgi:CRP-like cAMP-binding protein